MVQLSPEDVQDKSILQLKGFTLYHCQASSSSQKVRMYLRLKGLKYEARHVDILTVEHLQPEYLAVNPRGLLPLLVDDGEVFIESNDIILHLETTHSTPPLLPPDYPHDQLKELMDEENDIHFDLRKLSFRFVFNPPLPVKSEEVLELYSTHGTGTLNGQPDDQRDKEIDFWKEYNKAGLPDDEARRIVQEVIRPQFERLEQRLEEHDSMLGNSLSILDLVWTPFVYRFGVAGYPLEQLHPRLAAWGDRMMQDPIVKEEVSLPPPLLEAVSQLHAQWKKEGRSFTDVCFPDLA